MLRSISGISECVKYKNIMHQNLSNEIMDKNKKFHCVRYRNLT